MVGGSVNFGDAAQVTYFFYGVTLKTVTLLTEYTSGEPIVGKEPIPQGPKP